MTTIRINTDGTIPAASNMQTFTHHYVRALDRLWGTPEYEYVARNMTSQQLADKMVKSLANGTANKDSKAIRQTCKALGIKFTYQAIRDYLSS